MFLAIAGGMQTNRNEIGVDLAMGIMALALPMNRGLDPAVGIAHVKCARSICASSKYVKSLPHAPGRVGRKEGGCRRGVSGFRPSKGRIWRRRKTWWRTDNPREIICCTLELCLDGLQRVDQST